jgi:hypothetical protein
MQVIQEENHVDDDQQDYHSTSIKRTQQQGKKTDSNNHYKEKLHSLFDTDPSSSCKNDLYRSHSRGADLRFPPLIETSRGRIYTFKRT